MGVKMMGRIRSAGLGTFLNVGMGIVFIIAAVIVVMSVNDSMHRQALIEAQSKARIILDRNLATHTYFSQIMKPSIFAWSEPFRTKEYFDHTWMSSSYAIREIEKYFKSITPSKYSFKDAAIDARSPENEADEYERAFLEKLAIDKKLESESTVRTLGGEPYLVVLRKGEVMEASCLKCHSNPKDAPKGLTDYYGSERSFNRKAGDMVSAVSLRIPLAEAYAEANIFSLKLSAILLAVLACLFAIQYWLYRRYLLQPLNVMREKANEIATHEGHLGDQIPQPFGRELGELTATFNELSVKLRHDRDHLEELVDQRTEALRESELWMRGIFNALQESVLVVTPDRKLLNTNHATQNIFRYSQEELLNQSTEILHVDHEHYLEFGRRIQDAFDKGEAANFEFESKRKGGEIFPTEHTVSLLKGEKGEPKGIVSVVRDITERKQAEEEKRRLEERSHKLVDDVFRFIPEGVLVFSRKMELLRQNQAFRELVSGYARRLGFAEDELENLIIDKVKAGLRDNNIKEIKIARKHETGKQT